ncbi:MAG TPA: ATP-grasp domain-containing protein [Candidatus Binatia bacterium]
MTTQNKYVLILGGEYALRERVLAGAIRASNGLPVFTLTKTKTSPVLRFYDGFILGDVAHPAGVLAAVQKHQKETGATPAAVIPMNDFTVRSALAVSTHYGLRSNSAPTVDRCRDKFLMKQTLKAAGLPVPRFGAFGTLEELRQLIATIGLPVVIKPRELAGSVGVLKITTAEEIAPAFEQCMADVRALGGAYRTPEDVFLVEEYIPAKNEVSVEVINQGKLHQAIAVTDKYLGPEPYFVEVGHSMPSVHSENAALVDIAERACAALEIEYGIAHFEARITPHGLIRIIEVAARTGGDAIMDLVERTYGVNPYQLHVASYLGADLQFPEQRAARGLSAVSFLKAQEGVIESVTLPASLPESVVTMQVTGKPQDRSGKPISWAAREGAVEFFWRGREARPGFDEHLQLARTLAEEIFSVRPGS